MQECKCGATKSSIYDPREHRAPKRAPMRKAHMFALAVATIYLSVVAWKHWPQENGDHKYDIVLGWHTFKVVAFSLEEGELVFITVDGDKVTTPYTSDVRIVQLGVVK